MISTIRRLFIAALLCVAAYAAPTVPEHLQEISVTIKTNHGTGSGVVFTRKASDGATVNFVWTAAHVVDSLRTEREIVSADGSKRTVVEFGDARVVKEIYENARAVGRLELDAEVVKYSSADNGEDLALLRLRKTGFIQTTARFYLDKEPPSIGTELFHVGSLLGQMGSNSMTSGIVSQLGRVVNKRIYDQTTCTAFPGSSGGGVFLRDGRQVGVLTRGAGEGFNLIVPVRRVVEFAKRSKVEWAINPDVPLPSDEDIRKLPVEDNPNLGREDKDKKS